MSRLPDLVRDTRLNTSFKDNLTIHHYDESDDENGARSTWRSECWQQMNHLGHGGYGDVWLQQCVSGKRGYERRAVKIIPRFRLKDQKDGYMAELEAIAKFSQRRYSKCFVKLLGWYDTDASLYIAMEYFPLGDLENHMSSNGPMHEADAQEVSFQVLEGLSYMHREGFAHRDVKPGNVLIRSQPPKSKWWVKISDFGISKRVEGTKAQSTVRGTIQYMAPELIWHEAGNPINYMAADMWALGAMVYRMLTLMPVFSTPGAYNYYLVNVDSFPLQQLEKRDVSSDAISFIRSLMGPRPAERLASDKAMEHAWVAPFKSHLRQISTSLTPTPSNIHSEGRQSASTSDLNPWATISTKSTEFNIEVQGPSVTFPTSDNTTKVSSPSPIVEFIDNRLPTFEDRYGQGFELKPSRSVDFIEDRLPAIHDAFKQNVQYDPTSQRFVETQTTTDTDRSAAGEIQDNSRASLREHIVKPDSQTPIPPKSSAKPLQPAVYTISSVTEKFQAKIASTVHVKNIAAATGDAEIEDYFSFCGKITDIKVTNEGEMKSAKLTFEKETAMKTAILLNNTHLGPNQITVTKASAKPLQPAVYTTSPVTAKPQAKIASTVHVKNIAAATGDAEIEDFFSFCGKIADIKVTNEGKTKSAKLTFEKETAMKTAVLLNSTHLGPNQITVTKATDDEDTDDGLGGYGFFNVVFGAYRALANKRG